MLKIFVILYATHCTFGLQKTNKDITIFKFKVHVNHLKAKFNICGHAESTIKSFKLGFPCKF